MTDAPVGDVAPPAGPAAPPADGTIGPAAGGPAASDRGLTRMAAAIPLLAGLAALAASFALGGSGDVLAAIVTPPDLVRSALVGASVVLGLVLLRRAILRLEAAGGARSDVRATLRAIRLSFLALAAFAAAAGWLLGSALPLVIAGVIAAVDVVETSFLLLIVGRAPD